LADVDKYIVLFTLIAKLARFQQKIRQHLFVAEEEKTLKFRNLERISLKMTVKKK
jgi:hypothetical protein